MVAYNDRRDRGGYQGGGGHRQPPGSGYSVSKETLEEILDGRNPQTLVKVAEEIAEKELTAGPKGKWMTTSQIRNIYGTVKSIEGKGLSDEVIMKLVLLKPKLAYTAARHKELSGMEALRTVLTDSIDLVVDNRERFTNFCRFFEAILAYHKARGGK